MRTKNFVVALTIVGLAWGAAAGAEPAGPADPKTPTFYKDMLPLAQKHCQTCHRPGQIGPFSLLDYQTARPWAKAIKNAVSTRRMPPWFANPQYRHFNNDRSLSQAEMDTVVAWVDGGALAGDPKDAPPPVQWPAGGWDVQPDVSVDLPPYPVPATGVIEWETILIPAPFKEDTWVTSVQVLPGAPAVVHHMCFEFQKHKPGLPYNVYEWMEVPRDEEGVAVAHDGSTAPSARGREGWVLRRPVGSTEVTRFRGRQTMRGNTQFCYLPGLTLEDYRPVNAGVLVPAGSDIVFNLHYTTIGVATIDRTRIGFTVAKTPPARKVISLGGEDDSISSRIQDVSKLAIPPNDGNYLGPPADVTFKKDTELVWFRPHAHVRGKSVRYTLISPDGREEVVLDVPRYDFNWQLTYQTSLMIPKGSRMHVQYTYDNSAANRYNPDASKWVYFGGQSWEEMGSAMMGLLVDRNTNMEDIIDER